ncbi:MAG: cyclic dehypoxanthinyl futalosine synthase [Cyanobacteria bacterium P01_H01_bin.74]
MSKVASQQTVSPAVAGHTNVDLKPQVSRHFEVDPIQSTETDLKTSTTSRQQVDAVIQAFCDTGIVPRVSQTEALSLFRHAQLFELGILAAAVKKRIHTDPETGQLKPVGFVIDRNVNYTNVCNVDCLFCGFYRHSDAADAYTLTYPQIKAKTQELVDAGGTQLLLQGGVNPDLPFSYYLEIVRALRQDFPALTIHSFSPTEIAYMTVITGNSLQWVIQQLIDAGISSIPGAGGEILHDEIRRKVSHKKVNTHDWLEVMEVAHGLGLKTSATMMFGMMEKDWHIIDHLFQIRDLQDKTGGFLSFIPWTFQKANTKLERLPNPPATAEEYLRTTAVARIALDNISNIGSSWITQGLKLGQVALFYGANDMGGLLLEENVVTQCGINPTRKTVDEMLKVIHSAGFDAAQRNTDYSVVQRHPNPLVSGA